MQFTTREHENNPSKPTIGITTLLLLCSCLYSEGWAFQPSLIGTRPNVVFKLNRWTPEAIRRDLRDFWEEQMKKTDPSDSGQNSHSNNTIESSDVTNKQPRQRIFLESPVTTFTSIVECLDAIEQAPPNQLVVVLFFAHYCKMCHQTNIPYKKMAYKLNQDEIRLTRLETSVLTSRQLRSWGINKVPFIQIYRNEICVASFSTNWRLLESQLTDTLRLCKGRSISEWVSFRSQYDKEIDQNRQTRERLRSETLNVIPMQDAEPMLVRTIASETQLLEAMALTKTTSQTSEDGEAVVDNHNRSIGIQQHCAVIMFHSHFEQACVRAQHQYRKLAEHYHKQHVSPMVSSVVVDKDITTTNFVMYRLEANVLNDDILKSLGVSRYPHIQIYRDGICVASFSIPQSFIFPKLVHGSLDSVRRRTNKEWQEFFARRDVQTEITNIQRTLDGMRDNTVYNRLLHG